MFSITCLFYLFQMVPLLFCVYQYSILMVECEHWKLSEYFYWIWVCRHAFYACFLTHFSSTSNPSPRDRHVCLALSPTATFKKYESQLHGMVSLECLSILGLSLENYSFPFSHIHEVPCTWSPSTHHSRSFIPTKPIFSHYRVSVSHCP